MRKKDPRLVDPVAAARAEIERHRAKKVSGGMKPVKRPNPVLPSPPVEPAHGAQKPGNKVEPVQKDKSRKRRK